MGLKEFGLSGKIALITGAGKGLGEEIVLALAEAGADVSLAGRNLKNLNAVASRIRKIGRKALTIKTDVRREKDICRMVGRVLATFGKIDILVNNAGILRRIPSIKESLKEWQKTIDTNLTGPFLCMKACQPIMANEGSGTMINISSVAGLFGRANMAAYCASKAGVANLTRALAIDWAGDGIRVNAIAPGQLATSMGAPLFRDKKAFKEFLKSVPLRRVGNPGEVANLAVFLSSDASRYITGQVIVIDGGVTAH